MKMKQTNKLLALLLSLLMVAGIMPIAAFATEPEDEQMVFEKGWHTGPGYLAEYVLAANDSVNNKYYAMSSEIIQYQNEDGEDPAGYRDAHYETDLKGIKYTALAAKAVDGENDIISIPEENNTIAVMTAKRIIEGYQGNNYTYEFSVGTKKLVTREYEYHYYYKYPDEINYTMHSAEHPSLSFYESDSIPVNTATTYLSNGYINTTTKFDTVTYLTDTYEDSTTGTEFTPSPRFASVSVIQLLSTKSGLGFNPYIKSTDESTPIAAASIYTRVCKHEGMVEHNEVPATLGSDGTHKYYSCPECNGFYLDEAAENSIESWEIPIAHYLERIEAKAASCTETGIKQTYYKCANCNGLFLDAEGTNEFYDEHSMLIPVAGHNDADGDLICDVCNQEITPREFKKVINSSDITANGTYILVDENGNIMGNPVIDKEGNPENLIPSVSVDANDENKYNYYQCKAAGAMIFDLKHIYQYQNWGTDVSMVYGMYNNGTILSCDSGKFCLDNAEYPKYGMRFFLNDDKSVHIDSHYDNYWYDGSADNIFFRSYTDEKAGETVFAVNPDVGGQENKVYLYRMVECYSVYENKVEVADKKSDTDFSGISSTINSDAANGGTNVIGVMAALPGVSIGNIVSDFITENKIMPDTNLSVDARVDVTATAYIENESITFSLNPVLDFQNFGSTPIGDASFDGTTPITVILYTNGIYPQQIIHNKQDGTNEYFYDEYSEEVQKDGKKAFKVLCDSQGNQYVQFEVTEFSDVQILNTPIPEVKEPCDHTDKNNDYICDKCGETMISVSASSRLDIDDDVTVADITVSKEKVFSGEEVTVTTKSLDGYTFSGWFIGKDKVCDTLSYTFNPKANVALVAEYHANDNANLTVSNGLFTINGGTEKTNYDGIAHRIGTKITVSAVSEGFLNWKNENGKIVSTDPAYTFTLIGNTTLKMSIGGNVDGSDNSKNTALVEFVSDYSQVISAMTCDVSESIVLPYGPSKVGHTFIGWSVNGIYVNDLKTLDDIHAKIELGETHVVVKPVYEKKAETFQISIYVDGVENTELSKYSSHAGDTFTVSAPAVSGKNFKCWALDIAGENILSTDKSYFMQVGKSIAIYAIYVAPDVEVVKEPVVAITNIFATNTNDVHKVSFTATRNVPQGYTLIEQGMLYGRSNDFAETPTDETFIIGGLSVHQSASNNVAAAGVFTMNIRVAGIENKTIYARAYMIVKDNLTGNMKVVYSSIESGIYDNLIG